MDGIAKVVVPWTGREVSGFVDVHKEGKTTVIRIGGVALASYPKRSKEAAWKLFCVEFRPDHVSAAELAGET